MGLSWFLNWNPLRPWETRTLSHPEKKNKGLFSPHVACPGFTTHSSLAAALLQMVLTWNSGHWSLSLAPCGSRSRHRRDTEKHALSLKDFAGEVMRLASTLLPLARPSHMTRAAETGKGWYNLSSRRGRLWERIWGIWTVL